MNRKITLTTQEKNMNMAKLGIVSAAGNYFHSLGKWLKQRAGGLMAYTLCVFQGWAKRNGSRHSFAFDIPAISGRALFSVGKLVGSPGLTVIPGQSAMDGNTKAAPQNPASLAARGIRRILPTENNCSTFFSAGKRAFLPVGLPVSGGCHE